MKNKAIVASETFFGFTEEKPQFLPICKTYSNQFPRRLFLRLIPQITVATLHYPNEQKLSNTVAEQYRTIKEFSGLATENSQTIALFLQVSGEPMTSP